MRVEKAGTNVGEAYYDAQFHRGGRDARAENTLYAFQYALERGATTIECDMQITSDGVLVLSHNPILNPDFTRDEDGNYVEANTHIINRMTLDELRRFDVGHIRKGTDYYEQHGRTQIVADARIPTVRDLFELVRDSGRDHVRMSIEAKAYADPALGLVFECRNSPRGLLEPFDDLVREFGFEDRVLLQSFDWDFLTYMIRLNPRVRTVALYCEEPASCEPADHTLWLDRRKASPWLGGLNIHDFDDDPVRAAHALGIDYVSPYYEEVDENVVDEAHALGMGVIPWTVNDPQAIGDLYDMGVDGIISDRPWVLREVLTAKGASLAGESVVEAPYHLEGDHREV